MREEDIKMMQDIMDTEQVGYGYVYPHDGSERQEYYLSTRPDYLADFIAVKGMEADRIIITDVLDRLIVSTYMIFLDRCQDEVFRRELLKSLYPLQMEEKEPGMLLALDRKAAEEYFNMEDQGAATLEYGVEMG